MSKEPKDERFIRLAEARVNKIIKMVRLLGNLSGSSNYSYTDSQVEQRIWKNIRTTVFISSSPVLVCFLASPPVLQWARLQQSSDPPSNDIKQNMIRIQQEISYVRSPAFSLL